MWRTLRRVLLAVSVAGAASLSFVSSASAADLTDCPAGSLCGWSGTSYTGTMTKFSPGAGCLNAPFPLRSVANTYGGGVGLPAVMHVYSGANCTGALLATVHPTNAVPFLLTPGASVYTLI